MIEFIVTCAFLLGMLCGVFLALFVTRSGKPKQTQHKKRTVQRAKRLRLKWE